MDTNKIVKTRGIVLYEVKYKETSKIINLFTEKRGRINIFASGVLRPKSGLMLATEKFVESDFELTNNKNNFYIKGAEVINSNLEISKNLKSYFVGDMICELILKTMPEHFVDEKIYNLTTQCFEHLKSDKINPTLLKIGFIIKYMSFIGFRPQLYECVDCSSRDYTNMYFSHNDGGLICGNCLDINGEYVKLSKVEIEIMVKLLYGKFFEYEKLNLQQEVVNKVDNLIYDYMLYNTELSGLESQNRFKKLIGV